MNTPASLPNRSSLKSFPHFLFVCTSTILLLSHQQQQRIARTEAAASPPGNGVLNHAQQQQKEQHPLITLASSDSESPSPNALILTPTNRGGTRQWDYIGGYIPPYLRDEGFSYLRATSRAVVDPASYAALWQTMSVRPYLGRRVRLSGLAVVSDVLPPASYVALFLRVYASSGFTLALDNMADRRVSMWGLGRQWLTLVVDVPAGPPQYDDRCLPDDMAVPTGIAAGFMLAGGRGTVYIHHLTLEVVGSDVPVTGGPPPWEPPYGDFTG